MAVLDPILAAQKIHELYQPSFPVRPEYLAKEMGICVTGVKLSDNVSAVLVPEIVRRKRRYLIIVNNGHPIERQRFSIAHELGHYCLHRNPQPAFMHHQKHRDRREREANRFAAELLMPRVDVVAAAIVGCDFDEMLEVFGVSKLAMKRRIRELGLTIEKGAIA